ncbi:MAG: ferredoxin, partial [Planctomycetes bacterium]|nr:ferredoxin [Planctomycetota bacterium]
RINEELCNGCGKCVTPCAEGAIKIVNGKAKVIREELCDGAGFCLAVCPVGALTIEEREAAAFSEKAVEEHLKKQPKAEGPVIKCFQCDANEMDVAIFAVRMKGESRWVCAHCVPSLIHG